MRLFFCDSAFYFFRYDTKAILTLTDHSVSLGPGIGIERSGGGIPRIVSRDGLLDFEFFQMRELEELVLLLMR